MRLDVVASVSVEEGIWVISRPTEEIAAHANDCRLGAESGRYPTDFICTTEYGEVLLLDSQSGAILKAVPLPGIPPEFLLVTEDAVYCARNGEGMLPDSMVCRIDRATLEARVVVFPGAVDSVVVQPCFYPPDAWVLTDRPLAVVTLLIDQDGLSVGGAERLDPATLDLLAPTGGSGSATGACRS